MFENFDESVLVTPKNQFDRQKFLDFTYDMLKDKRVNRQNGGGKSKAERLELFDRVINGQGGPDKFKEQLWEDLVNKEQVIPEEFWYPHTFFREGTALARLNPHFMVTFYDAVNRNTNPSDTLMLIHCKETKPYSLEPSVKAWMKQAEKSKFDIAVLSASIVPVYPHDSSRQYPFNIYNWPSNREGQYNELVTWQTCIQLGYMIAKLNYKRVILISSGNYHYTTQLDEMKKHLDDKVEIFQLNKPDTFSHRIAMAYFKAKGIASLRFNGSVLGRYMVAKSLGHSPYDYLGEEQVKMIEEVFWKFVKLLYPNEDINEDNIANYLKDNDGLLVPDLEHDFDKYKTEILEKHKSLGTNKSKSQDWEF